jgi:WD40 repeat protein
LGREFFSTPATSTHTLRFSLDDRYLSGGWNGRSWDVYEFAMAAEYRVFAVQPSSTRAKPTYVSFSQDGRLLAAGTYVGVRLWDVVTGEQMPTVPSSEWTTVGFPTGADEMLTYGPLGVFRWPLAGDDGPGTLRIGPPELLFKQGAPMKMAHSLDGQVVCLAGFDVGSVVLHRKAPTRTVVLQPQTDVRYLTVSPDGRLVVTCSHNGTGAGAYVWETDTGRRVAVLSVPDMARCDFSPDGRSLAVDTGRGTIQIWDVGTWRAGLEFQGIHPCYSPDRAILAVARGHSIRLLDPASGRELATLEHPNLIQPRDMVFSPDGRRIAVTDNTDAIHVWDLRPIRTQLAGLGLDWDRTPVSPSDSRAEGPPIGRVTIIPAKP